MLKHEPVLLEETLKVLQVSKLAHLDNQARFIDATAGAGGHSFEIVKLGGNVLAMDSDKEMLELAKARLEEACPPRQNELAGSFKLVNSNFRNIDQIARQNDFYPVDGVLIDLGISSVHYVSSSRGFSFQYPDAPLDMRLSPQTQSVMACDLLNGLREEQLISVFKKAMPWPEAKMLVRRIVAKRLVKPYEKVGDFLEHFVKFGREKKTHPGTKAFLALRMAVNSELENIEEVIPASLSILKRGGRIAIITFHSTEDALVKDIFRKLVDEGLAKLITKKPIIPSEEEIRKNSKARSAKLRVIQKI